MSNWNGSRKKKLLRLLGLAISFCLVLTYPNLSVILSVLAESSQTETNAGDTASESSSDEQSEESQEQPDTVAVQEPAAPDTPDVPNAEGEPTEGEPSDNDVEKTESSSESSTSDTEPTKAEEENNVADNEDNQANSPTESEPEIEPEIDLSMLSEIATLSTGDSDSCGDNCTWKYDDTTKTLTISGTGAMADCSNGKAPWNSIKPNIETVVINAGVTKIGSSAFDGCTKLKNVTIPNGVTEISSWAFQNCTALTTIELPSSATLIQGFVFSGCTNLNNILLPNVKTISNGLFENCRSLTGIAIPNAVESIQAAAFKGCSGLTNIIIPEGVTSITGSAFEGCTSLKSINIPSKVTTIYDQAFKGCTKLETVTIEGAATIGDNTFNGCTALTTVKMNDATKIGSNAFDGCTRLNSVTMDKVTSIGNSAFYGCRSLTSIIIPSSVKSIGNQAFEKCSGLENVTIPDGVTTIVAWTFKDCTNLKSVELPASVSVLQNYVFEGCTKLTTITMPGVTSMGASAFKNCTGLTSIEIPSSVTEIYTSTFEGCTGLTTVTMPNVTSIGNNAFKGCTALTSDNLTIPEGVTTIGNYAFSDCDSLTTATIPESVTSIGEYAFSECDNLESVDIQDSPDSSTTIGNWAFTNCPKLANATLNGVKTISDRAFYNCSGLETVSMNNATSIGASAFEGCTNLTGIMIPDGVTSIGSFAFSGCKGLTELTMSEGVETIGPSAFSSCTGITNVTIPASVDSIGASAFSGCTGLKTVEFKSTEAPTLEIDVFKGCTLLTSTDNPEAGIKVPEGCVFAYENAWKDTFPEFASTTKTHYHLPCGSTTCSHEDGAHTDKVEYVPLPAPVDGTITLEPNKNYYLTGPVELTKSITINTSTGGNTINICLNGYAITGKNCCVFNIVDNSAVDNTVNICDCSKGKSGIIKVDKTNTLAPNVINVNNATLNIYGGAIKCDGSSIHGVSLGSKGALNMYGGEISTYAYSICVNSNVKGVNIYGGDISSSNTSAIYAASSSIINITDSTISNNSNSSTIYTTGGSLTISGNNNITNNGSGYAITCVTSGNNKPTLKITGGSIKGGSGISFSGEKAEISVDKVEASNGHAFYQSDSSSPSTISKGTFSNSSNDKQTIFVQNGTLNITGGDIANSGSNYAVYVTTTSALNFSGGTIGTITAQKGIGNYGKVIISGESTKITCTEKAIENYHTNDSCKGELTVTGGTISGNVGILNKGGKVEVSGNAKIGGKSFGIENENYTSNNQSYQGTVNIKGGTIECTGTDGHAILNGLYDGGSDSILTIQGATTTITSPSVSTIKNHPNAEVEIQSGTIKNTRSTGVGEVISNSGELYIAGGTYTSNSGYISNHNILKLCSTPKFTNTGIKLFGDSKIKIVGSPINFNDTLCPIYVDDDPVQSASPITVTSDWNRYMSDKQPSDYFVSGLKYCTVEVAEVTAADGTTTNELILRPSKVTFNYNDDTGKSTVLDLGSNAMVTFPTDTGNTGYRIGYTFKGWFTEAENGVQVANNNEFTKGDTTLYAHWEKCTVHNFTGYTKTDTQHSSVCTKCKETVTAAHDWTKAEESITPATCAKEGSKTLTCVCGEKQTEVINKIPHTVVTDNAVPATCTKHGKTAGSHCSVCNSIIVKQNETPLAEHTVVTDNAVSATCTEKGKTAGSHCSVCNSIIVKQNETPLADHTLEKVNATVNVKEHYKCSVCGKLFIDSAGKDEATKGELTTSTGGSTNPGVFPSYPGGGNIDPEVFPSYPGGGNTNPGGGTKPGGGTTNPGGGSTNPGGGSTNPGGGSTNPGGGSTNPGGGTNPSGGSTNPGGTSESQPVTVAPAEPTPDGNNGGNAPVANGSAPGANGNTPGANGNAPGANGNAPGANNNAPGANNNAPGANNNAPGANGNEPGANGNEPGANNNAPGANGNAPGANGNEPVANGSEPGANGNEPGANGSESGANGSEPGANGNEPGANGSESGANGNESGDNGNAPGDNGSEPGGDNANSGGSTNPSGDNATTIPDSKFEELPTDEQGNKVQENGIAEIKSAPGAPTALVMMQAEKIIQAVLTAEEQEIVQKGEEEVKILLTVEDGTQYLTSEAENATQKILVSMKDYKLGQYIEVNLIKQVGDKQEKITQTKEPIPIVFQIPENLRNDNRVYSMLRIHDGETAKLPDLDQNPNTVTIETDKFSTYVLTYSDAGATNPFTQIVIPLLIVAGAIILIVSITVIVILALRKRKEQKVQP